MNARDLAIYQREGAAGLARIADRLLSRKGLAPGKSKTDRRKDRNTRMAEIRKAVMDRAAREAMYSTPTCETCGFERATEVHHIISGGARQSAEDATTLIALCAACHREAQRGEPLVLSCILTWAKDHGYTEAHKAVSRRLAKVEEARRK
jgi:hypothetical protein